MRIDNWFAAIVTNIADPLGAGRVQVRCYEYHELDDANRIPDERLPWATPMLPITSASSSGVGTSATGLMVGSWVFGFFRDEDLQDPVVIATIPGATNLSGGGADIPDDASASSVGASFASATNTSQYVGDAPVANTANTTAFGDKAMPGAAGGIVGPPAPATVYTKTLENTSNFITNGADMAGLNSEFRQRCENMAAEYTQLTGKRMTVTGKRSAYRTYDQQVQIYKTARKGYAATPGTSNHGFGFALDVNSADVNKAAQMGLLAKHRLFRPMLSSKLYEPWHIEPIGLDRNYLAQYRGRKESGKFTGDQLGAALPT